MNADLHDDWARGASATLRLRGRARGRTPRALVEAAQLALIGHATETLEQLAVSAADAPAPLERGEGGATLSFTLHPLATPVVLEVDAQGAVTITGETLVVGPGYDAHVRATLDAVARDLGLELEHAPAPSSEARALAFLADEARRAAASTAPRQIGGFGRHRYPDVPLATLLGPRDPAWLAAVLADPSAGRDVFPWWSEGLDPAARLGRALAQLWHEVRFRPLFSEAEEELAESVLEDLRGAYREAPELSYPVEAWAELAASLDGHGAPPDELFARPAAEAPPGVRGAIGYRRGRVEREVGAGFSLLLPGALAEEEHDEGVWAGDLERSVHVAGILADEDAPPEALFAEAPAPEGAPIALAPRTAGLALRAAIREAEGERVLTAVAASTGRVCLLTAIERGRDTGFVREVAASLALAP
jgi:hypothetical protein